MPYDITATEIAAFADAAGDGDEAAPFDLASGALGAGITFPTVLRDLVAEAQILVGLRWQLGEWTVAREHAATATTGNVVRRLATTTTRAPDRRRMVIVTVAAGEWHSLGAELVAHTLRSEGWRVLLLPPGTRPGQLASAVHDHGPAAVAITCSLGGLLPGARRLIAAAQDAGTPAIVGGRAFGGDGTRARRLGADGWAPDLVSAPAAIATHAGFAERRPVTESEGVDEYSLVVSDLTTMTDRIRSTTAHLSERESDVHVGGALWIVRSLAASLLVDDPGILADDVAWATQRSQVGGPDVDQLVDTVAAALPEGATYAASLLERARAATGAGPSDQSDGGK